MTLRFAPAIQGGRPVDLGSLSMAPGQVAALDCKRLLRGDRNLRRPEFVEGMLTIGARTELSVSAVYTATAADGVRRLGSLARGDAHPAAPRRVAGKGAHGPGCAPKSALAQAEPSTHDSTRGRDGAGRACDLARPHMTRKPDWQPTRHVGLVANRLPLPAIAA